MSPNRRRRRTPLPHRHSRREVAVAVGAGAGAVLFAVVCIWLLRPGTGAPGTGGLAHRQPRATWLVVLAIVAAVIGVTRVLRRAQGTRRRRVGVSSVLVGVMVLALVAGTFWPGGLLRHPAPVIDLSGVDPDVSLPEGITVPDGITLPEGITVPGATPTGETTTPGAPGDTGAGTTGP